MDWTQIILAIVGLFGVVDLGRLLFFRSSRKQAEGEADSAAVAPLKEANEILRQQLIEADGREDRLEARNAELAAQKDDLYKQLIEAREESAVLKQHICVHAGCGCRKPKRADGPRFYERYKDELESQVDTLPINVLLKEYGKQKAEKIKAAAEEGLEDA